MLLPFSIRVAELPPVWERAVHSDNCTLVKFCMCPSFPFGIAGGMWGVIVLIPDHCLSLYFSPPLLCSSLLSDQPHVRSGCTYSHTSRTTT